MIATELKKDLSLKFNIVNFADVSTLTDTPTSAYRFFNSVWQPEYTPQSRIVLYTDQLIPDELLEHLYQTTESIDISNWFVLLCTPYDLGNRLEKICQRVSPSSTPYQNLVIPIDSTNELNNNYKLPDTICAIPWMNIEIKSNGDITPCCMFKGTIGHISNDLLQDAFYSDQMNDLRRNLKQGIQPTGCQNCWTKESQGLSSTRQQNTKRLKNLFMFDYYDTPKISTLDIKFQNTCNFKCRICGPKSSSLHVEEQSKFLNIPMVPQSKWSESDVFVNQINSLLPQLINIDMYGGEPFLIKKFLNVLKKAVDTDVAKNIRLHYNTNGSIWPGEFIEHWPYFKEVDIHFSIDAIGNQFNLQRGGNWQEVEGNILRIKNLNFPNMKFSVMPSISLLNVFYIDQVLEWSAKHDFQVFVTHISVPPEFALTNLTADAKKIILDKYQNTPWPEMQKILMLIKNIPPTDGKSFCNKIQWYDSVRKENFAESHPEIAKAMGYVYNINL